MKFIEGKNYEFNVLKKVDLPEEGDFFLLRHESGRRLMLPVSTYSNYNIIPGQSIECKVDKVNCTGKLFLEPKHPVYEVGKFYLFEVKEIIFTDTDINSAILVVLDAFGSRVRVAWDENLKIPENDKIRLKVLRIKKGIPQLAIPEQGDEIENFEQIIGSTLSFDVMEVTKNISGVDVFPLINPAGFKSELKVKYFKPYGFSIGDTIDCEVYGITHYKFLKVEPKNPYYTIGEVYEFKLSSILEIIGDNDDIQELNLIVDDYFGNKCGMNINPDQYNSIKNKTQLNCRVVGFRKGRPKLMIEL
jgi:hypothetical protein